MKITYYVVDSNNIICEREISTEDPKYVSHTKDTVKIYWYQDYDWGGENDTRTYICDFNKLKKARVELYKKDISKLQQELEMLENTEDYKDYRRLIYKKD